MNDIDLSSPVCIDDTPCRSQVKQSFTASSIENLLKRKDSIKRFIVIENNLKKNSSTAWSTFGFPAQQIEDGAYERIHGFASCFQCKTTYTFQSDGSGSTKHLLRHRCSKPESLSEGSQRGPLHMLFKSRQKAAAAINSKDSTEIKDALTRWVCRSVRPFNIVEDAGLRDILQTVLDLGKSNKY